MTVKEVAIIENKNVETVRRWIRSGELKKHGYVIAGFNSKKEGYSIEKDNNSELKKLIAEMLYHEKKADELKEIIKAML